MPGPWPRRSTSEGSPVAGSSVTAVLPPQTMDGQADGEGLDDEERHARLVGIDAGHDEQRPSEEWPGSGVTHHESPNVRESSLSTKSSTACAPTSAAVA